jgi:hypothetical protein
MNKEQALAILVQATAAAPLTRAQHIQVEEALKLIAETLKEVKKEE